MGQAYLANLVTLHQPSNDEVMMYSNNYNRSFSVREVSEIIGVERSAIYRLIKNRKLIPNVIKPIRIGKVNLQSFVLKRAPKAHVLWEKER